MNPGNMNAAPPLSTSVPKQTSEMKQQGVGGDGAHKSAGDGAGTAPDAVRTARQKSISAAEEDPKLRRQSSSAVMHKGEEGSDAAGKGSGSGKAGTKNEGDEVWCPLSFFAFFSTYNHCTADVSFCFFFFSSEI